MRRRSIDPVVRDRGSARPAGSGPPSASRPLWILEHVVPDVAAACVVDDGGAEASLEEVAVALVATIEVLRVPAVQAAHPAQRASVVVSTDQVKVVRHQAVRVQTPTIPSHDPVEHLHEDTSFHVVREDLHAVNATRRDVECAFTLAEIAARRTSHDSTVVASRTIASGSSTSVAQHCPSWTDGAVPVSAGAVPSVRTPRTPV